jgi:glucosyl-dolichyl phosphate glucuronosyltransferase
LISIVVTSYNTGRIEQIEELIDSIQRQSSHDFEVIYVTEGSPKLHDEVHRIVSASGLGGKVVHSSARLGLAGARNLGLKTATGELIGFVDDDVILSDEWIHTVVNSFKSLPDAAGITGPAYPLFDAESHDMLPVQFDYLIGCTRWMDEPYPTPVTNVWGMNMCFRSKVLRAVGGLKLESGMVGGQTHGGIGEDIEVSLKIRLEHVGNLYWIPDMVVYNHASLRRLTPRFILSRSIRVGADRKAVKRLGSSVERRLIRSLLLDVLFLKWIRKSRPTDLTQVVKTVILATLGLVLGYYFLSGDK